MGHAIPIEAAIDRVAGVLSRTPAGLFTDIDGTISQVARTPSEATVEEPARRSLRRLESKLAIVGAITGRAADNAAEMLGLEGTVVIGNHGYERLQHGERIVHPLAIASLAAVSACVRAMSAIVAVTPRLDGVIVEDKNLSASVHYRLVEDQGRTVELLKDVIRSIAELHDLNVTEGRLVVEIRPREVVTKGTAIRDLAREMGLSGVVYLGDDVTDVDAFRALRDLASPETATLSIGVVSAETNPIVAETADLLVDGVEGCVALLNGVADRLAPSVG